MGTNAFKLNSKNDYEIAKMIPSAAEVKKQVPMKILKYFNGDVDGENKTQRIGISNPDDAAYIAYNNAVEQYCAEAEAEIAMNEAYLASLSKVTINIASMPQEILVEVGSKEKRKTK